MEILNPVPVKEPKLIGRRQKFTIEYQTMVARTVIEGKMTYRDAAKTFGTSQGTIAACLKRYKKGSWGNSTKIEETSEKLRVQRLETNVRELKEQIANLYLENLMLKKIHRHSQRIKKEGSSIVTSETLAQLQMDAE
jgi:transposase-like protein